MSALKEWSITRIVPNIDDVVDGISFHEVKHHGGRGGGGDKPVELSAGEHVVSAKYSRVKKSGDYWNSAIITFAFATNKGAVHEFKTSMTTNYKENELDIITVSAPEGKYIASFKTTIASGTRHSTPVLGSIEIDQLMDLR